MTDLQIGNNKQEQLAFFPRKEGSPVESHTDLL